MEGKCARPAGDCSALFGPTAGEMVGQAPHRGAILSRLVERSPNSCRTRTWGAGLAREVAQAGSLPSAARGRSSGRLRVEGALHSLDAASQSSLSGRVMS